MATTSPSCDFSLAESGMMIPPFTVSCSSMRLMRTRSYKGLNDILESPYAEWLGAVVKWMVRFEYGAVVGKQLCTIAHTRKSPPFEGGAAEQSEAGWLCRQSCNHPA